MKITEVADIIEAYKQGFIDGATAAPAIQNLCGIMNIAREEIEKMHTADAFCECANQSTRQGKAEQAETMHTTTKK